MTDKNGKLTIRVRPEVQRALDKIIAVKTVELGKFGETDAVSVSVLAYAKVLPDVPDGEGEGRPA